MRVTFVANFMNHHQLAFSLEMQKLTDGGYTFIAFEPLAGEQQALGYADMNMLPFVIRAYEDEKQCGLAYERILSDDMVIFGSCPNEVVDCRAKTGKPYIIYSERFFKKGTYRRFIPMTRKKIYERCTKRQGDNVSIICSSAYLPYDLYLLKAKFQTYKWGYFPENKKYEDFEKLLNLKQRASILWVARFITLKHPEAPVLVAKRLKEEGYQFTLNLIGIGPLERKIKKLIDKKDLSDCVKLLGAMSPEEVRKHMERSEMFLFTSDQHEGWGAVMNEAMNSGCAVVASHAVGSVPFLVKHGTNGLVYRNGDIDDLYKKVKYLCDNPDQCRELGGNAYKTITNEWCAETATMRLYKIIQAKINGEQEPVYLEGPCSPAEIIRQKYKEEVYD